MNNDEWRLKAYCKGKETNFFYPEPGVKGTARQLIDAKSFCNLCPVINECLECAIQNNEEFGVWGGLTPKERSRIISNRKRSTSAKEVGIRLVKSNDSNRV